MVISEGNGNAKEIGNEVVKKRSWKEKKFSFWFLFNWVSLICNFNISLRVTKREKAMVIILRALELFYSVFYKF